MKILTVPKPYLLLEEQHSILQLLTFHFESFIITIICFLPPLLVLFPSLSSNTHLLAFLFEDNSSFPLPLWVRLESVGFQHQELQKQVSAICLPSPSSLLLISRSRQNICLLLRLSNSSWGRYPGRKGSFISTHFSGHPGHGKIWLTHVNTSVLTILDVDKTGINTVFSKRKWLYKGVGIIHDEIGNEMVEQSPPTLRCTGKEFSHPVHGHYEGKYAISVCSPRNETLNQSTLRVSWDSALLL